MTDLRKAAEMALDALRLYVTMYPQMDKGYMVDARETLRQALAQGEQEHIECGYDETVGMCTNNPCCEQAQPEPQVCCGDYEKCMKPCTPRGRWLAEKELAKPEQEELIQFKDGKWSYVRKPWQGLTDDEIKKIVDLNTSDDGGFDIWCDGIAVARIVCAKLKELNK